jgi:hypothetical protein
MWGKRRNRGAQLPRQLALGLLEDAMARAEEQRDEAPEPVPYAHAPVVPSARDGLAAQDVPVDNSAGPAPEAAGQGAPGTRQDLPAQRTGDSTRHRSFG